MSLSLSASQCGQENFQYSHANVQQLLWRKEKCDLRASSFQWARSEECEIAEEYITALYTLVEVCAYGNMRRATQKPPNSWDQRLSFRTSCSSTLHLLWRRPTRRSDRMKQFGSSTSGWMAATPINLPRWRRSAVVGRTAGELMISPTSGSHQDGPNHKVQPKLTSYVNVVGNGDTYTQRSALPLVICHRCEKKGHFMAHCMTRVRAARAQKVQCSPRQ